MKRSKKEAQEWRKKDPIGKFRKQLIEIGVLTKKSEEEMDKEIQDFLINVKVHSFDLLITLIQTCLQEMAMTFTG